MGAERNPALATLRLVVASVVVLGVVGTATAGVGPTYAGMTPSQAVAVARTDVQETAIMFGKPSQKAEIQKVLFLVDHIQPTLSKARCEGKPAWKVIWFADKRGSATPIFVGKGVDYLQSGLC